MSLPINLVSDFVKTTMDTTDDAVNVPLYGTVVEYKGETYVRFDGSDVLTPIAKTADIRNGERVMVNINNHTATVTGNVTSPSARQADVESAEGKILVLETDSLEVKEWMSVKGADIETLKAKNVEINGKLDVNYADILDLKANKMSVTEADLKYATIVNLNAATADISDLKADKMSVKEADLKYATIVNLNAATADISALKTGKLDASEAKVTYANIDFSNIGKAAMEYFYANSGLIKNVSIGDATITGELIGVTIKGNLIEGGTVVADKLVIKGTDGLYYKLNTDGVKTETEQTEYNSINGSVILAQSITATKINVDDLVAFEATIGGFNITENSIYSGVKESVTNSTKGIYLDNDGQIAFGDSNSYVIFYKTETGEYKLRIAADDVTFGPSRKSIEEELELLKDEVSTILRIESSRGTVFKNDSVSTVLSVVIYRGSERITDMTALKNSMGQSAYLQWKWQKFNEDTYGIISADDDRIGNDGFTFTLSPDDVNTKVTFICELIN